MNAVEVYAIGDALVSAAIGEAGDVDTSVVALRMASGALGQIDCSRRAALRLRRENRSLWIGRASGCRGARISGACPFTKGER